jgi:hypothetical protein
MEAALQTINKKAYGFNHGMNFDRLKHSGKLFRLVKISTFKEYS